jgi:hypothetical protein
MAEGRRTFMESTRTNIGSFGTGSLAAPLLILCGMGCMASPPEGPAVEGPTLSIELARVSQADVGGSELVAAAPLDEVARAVHAGFVAAHAATIGSERLLALRAARVSLRPGIGVDDLADAFDGMMVFVALENDRMARVFMASAVAPARTGPVELGLIAKRLDYQAAQSLLMGSGFIVGVSGPTPLRADRAVEFGLGVELDLAIIELASGKGGH